ncbi:MAG: response regulator [Pseudomonadota bacterium]
MVSEILNIYWPRDASWTPLETAKRRIFSTFALAMSLIGVEEAVLSFSIYWANPLTFALLLLATVSGLLAPILTRRARSIQRVSQVVIALAYITVASFITTLGLAASSSLLILFCILATALLLGPWHSAAGVVFAGCIYFYAYYNYHAPGMVSPFQIEITFAKVGTFAAAATAFCSWIFLREMSRAAEELKRQQEVALNASKSKSEFLANMSHEIRTPMNGILGMTELLQNTSLDEQQKTFAKTIYASGDALLTIINDILDFSKIEAGKLELDPVPFNLAQAVEDVATLLGVTARQKKLELMVRVEPDLPSTLVGDVGRFRQILTNIVGNAIKFTHEGSVLIDVSTTAINGERADLTIAVSDTGIGISEDKIGLIFEKFAQAESSTTRNFGGTGLGLSITNSLVEAMGGRINVSSTIGEGSTFSICLSLPIGEDPFANEEAVLDASLSNRKILVVDDNEVNRSILKEYLTSWGAEVVLAKAGEEALRLLNSRADASETPDLILLDYHMPEMDGLEFLAAVRSNPMLHNTGVIVLSSVDDDSVAEQFRQLGVTHLMPKPVRAKLLNSSINAQLQEEVLPTLKEIASGVQVKAHGKKATPISDNSAKRRILIAEDNHVNRMVLANMIDHDTNEIEFAENGKIAFDKAKSGMFDLILMDISMPVMDGIEATKAIRTFETKSKRDRTPIIALTAHAMADERDRFLESELDDYLSKPIKVDQIAAILQKWSRIDSGAMSSEAVGTSRRA